MGALSVPPGPVTLELWIRISDIGRLQTIFDSWGAALSLGLDGDGRLNLVRVNQERQAVWLKGEKKLMNDKWHHVVAVFTGEEIRICIDGKQDGKPVAVHGTRTDENSVIGFGTGMLKSLAGRHEGDNGYLKGDIGRFRLLQLAMDDEEIAGRYEKGKEFFDDGKKK